MTFVHPRTVGPQTLLGSARGSGARSHGTVDSPWELARWRVHTSKSFTGGSSTRACAGSLQAFSTSWRYASPTERNPRGMLGEPWTCGPGIGITYKVKAHPYAT
jgi:hypothetical protein